MNKIKSFINRFEASEKNIIWNMIGGGWNGALLIIVTPIYISVIGLDGYGILGLWLMMLSLSNLFDIGIGSSIVREFAMHSSSSNKDFPYLRGVLKTLEIVYWAIAFFICIFLLFSAENIGNIIKSNAFSTQELTKIITSLFLAVSFQFPTAIYSSGLLGLQKQGILNLIIVISNTSRHIFGLIVLVITEDINTFFNIQIVISLFQILLTRFILVSYIENKKISRSKFRLEIIKKLWKFSAGMSLTAILALLIANLDRVAISLMLTTEDLGYYTIAYSGVIVLQMGIQPFYKAYYPRYAELVKEGRDDLLAQEYFKSCGLMSSIILPIIFIGYFFAPELFQIWLQDNNVTSVKIFRFLLIGIGLSGLMWLPAALQHAYGWTSLHLKMLLLAIIVGSPIMLILISLYGVVGATALWATHGVIETTIAVYLMHKKILPNKLRLWVYKIVFIPSIIAFSISAFSNAFLPDTDNQFFILICIFLTGFITALLIHWYNKVQKII